MGFGFQWQTTQRRYYKEGKVQQPYGRLETPMHIITNLGTPDSTTTMNLHVCYVYIYIFYYTMTILYHIPPNYLTIISCTMYSMEGFYCHQPHATTQTLKY